MKQYQEILIKLRAEKNLSIEAAASQLNLSETTLAQFEQTDDVLSLGYALPALKNALRKYAELLGMPERRIVSMLNRVDYLDFKRSRKGKMTGFDYLNRLVILGLIIVLGFVIHAFYDEQKELANRQIDIVLPSPVATQPTRNVPTPAVIRAQTTVTTENLDNNNTNNIPTTSSQNTHNIKIPADIED